MGANERGLRQIGPFTRFAGNLMMQVPGKVGD
jgi:hypothetical protein